jgi:1,6-anhydro-N-acetylmuramate kinase
MEETREGEREGGRERRRVHNEATYLEHAPGVSLEDGGRALDIVAGRDILRAAVYVCI